MGALYRYFNEISGHELHHRMSEVMSPASAKKDEEVLKYVEAWEDRYRECVKLGMEELKECFRITIIRMIATEDIRKELDRKMPETYEEARELATRVSRQAKLEKAKTPYRPSADVAMGGVNNLGMEKNMAHMVRGNL